jgi:hypothetical protein
VFGRNLTALGPGVHLPRSPTTISDTLSLFPTSGPGRRNLEGDPWELVNGLDHLRLRSWRFYSECRNRAGSVQRWFPERSPGRSAAGCSALIKSVADDPKLDKKEAARALARGS